MRATLNQVIDRLDEVDDTDRYAPLEIYAEGGRDAISTARAVVCPGDEEGALVCPRDPAMRCVLMVQSAKEAIEVWSDWRGGRVPGPQDKFAAVMFYARNDAFLPVEGDA